MNRPLRLTSAVVADCKWCDESGNDDEEIDDEYEIHSRDFTEAFV